MNRLLILILSSGRQLVVIVHSKGSSLVVTVCAFLIVVCAALLSSAPPTASQSSADLHQPAGAMFPPDFQGDELTSWTSLFDGKSLGHWKTSEFGGDGEVKVEDGCIILGAGVDLTGIKTDRKLAKQNYEVALEARRVDGADFFCGLTFPVGDDPCSLIVGGWGGGVIGLSSIDDMDASENDSTTYHSFENGRWYRIRLRVTPKQIQAWIDDKMIVDQDITNRRISIRSEVELSKPFGFASWQTTAALRDIRIRELPPE
jgi:hypothetical protein